MRGGEVAQGLGEKGAGAFPLSEIGGGPRGRQARACAGIEANAFLEILERKLLVFPDFCQFVLGELVKGVGLDVFERFTLGHALDHDEAGGAVAALEVGDGAVEVHVGDSRRVGTVLLELLVQLPHAVPFPLLFAGARGVDVRLVHGFEPRVELHETGHDVEPVHVVVQLEVAPADHEKSLGADPVFFQLGAPDEGPEDAFAVRPVLEFPVDEPERVANRPEIQVGRGRHADSVPARAVPADPLLGGHGHGVAELVGVVGPVFVEDRGIRPDPGVVQVVQRGLVSQDLECGHAERAIAHSPGIGAVVVDESVHIAERGVFAAQCVVRHAVQFVFLGGGAGSRRAGRKLAEKLFEDPRRHRVFSEFAEQFRGTGHGRLDVLVRILLAHPGVVAAGEIGSGKIERRIHDARPQAFGQLALVLTGLACFALGQLHGEPVLGLGRVLVASWEIADNSLVGRQHVLRVSLHVPAVSDPDGRLVDLFHLFGDDPRVPGPPGHVAPGIQWRAVGADELVERLRGGGEILLHVLQVAQVEQGVAGGFRVLAPFRDDVAGGHHGLVDGAARVGAGEHAAKVLGGTGPRVGVVLVLLDLFLAGLVKASVEFEGLFRLPGGIGHERRVLEDLDQVGGLRIDVFRLLEDLESLLPFVASLAGFKRVAVHAGVTPAELGQDVRFEVVLTQDFRGVAVQHSLVLLDERCKIAQRAAHLLQRPVGEEHLPLRRRESAGVLRDLLLDESDFFLALDGRVDIQPELALAFQDAREDVDVRSRLPQQRVVLEGHAPFLQREIVFGETEVRPFQDLALAFAAVRPGQARRFLVQVHGFVHVRERAVVQVGGLHECFGGETGLAVLGKGGDLLERGSRLGLFAPFGLAQRDHVAGALSLGGLGKLCSQLFACGDGLVVLALFAELVRDLEHQPSRLLVVGETGGKIAHGVHGQVEVTGLDPYHRQLAGGRLGILGIGAAGKDVELGAGFVVLALHGVVAAAPHEDFLLVEARALGQEGFEEHGGLLVFLDGSQQLAQQVESFAPVLEPVRFDTDDPFEVLDGLVDHADAVLVLCEPEPGFVPLGMLGELLQETFERVDRSGDVAFPLELRRLAEDGFRRLGDGVAGREDQETRCDHGSHEAASSTFSGSNSFRRDWIFSAYAESGNISSRCSSRFFAFSARPSSR